MFFGDLFKKLLVKDRLIVYFIELYEFCYGEFGI